MPRPNPPRKRPRRRPDAVERSARAEVSLARQTAQVKEKGDSKQQSNGKQQPASKARLVGKGTAARGRRIDEPFIPWAKRSYLILVALLAAAEVAVGSLAFFTLADPKPAFGLYVLGVSYNPLVPVASALVAAPLAKLITKEPRSLRFMESVMSGIMQYFVWLALFVALEYLTGGFVSSKTAAVTVSTPAIIVELIVIDVLSFAATFLLYPWLNKFMRRRPPPSRTPPAKKAKPEEARQSSKSIVDRMDEASARDPQAKGPTP
jgi:membrane protein implicated in regulation of membrane protease activity